MQAIVDVQRHCSLNKVPYALETRKCYHKVLLLMHTKADTVNLFAVRKCGGEVYQRIQHHYATNMYLKKRASML